MTFPVVPRRERSYGDPMTGQDMDAPEPDVMEMFDTDAAGGLVCRVCGSLVSSAGEYAKAHWDWHETPNGA
jgi:hypothetical protein